MMMLDRFAARRFVLLPTLALVLPILVHTLPLASEIEEVSESSSHTINLPPESPLLVQSTNTDNFPPPVAFRRVRTAEGWDWVPIPHPLEPPSSPPRAVPPLASDTRAFRIEGFFSPREPGSPVDHPKAYAATGEEDGVMFAPGAPKRVMREEEAEKEESKRQGWRQGGLKRLLKKVIGWSKRLR